MNFSRLTVEQPERLAHSRRGEVQREGPGRLATPVQVAAAQHRGRGRVQHRRRVQVAATHALQGYGAPVGQLALLDERRVQRAQVLEPAEPAQMAAVGLGLAHVAKPPAGERGDPRIQPVRARIQGLGQQPLELARRKWRQTVEVGAVGVRRGGVRPVAPEQVLAERHRPGRRRRSSEPVPDRRTDEAGAPGRDPDELRLAAPVLARSPVGDQDVERAARVLEQHAVLEQQVQQRRVVEGRSPEARPR
jgi:hypothetical protein